MEAAGSGNWRKAGTCYASLEQLEPAEPTWALKLGECQRKLGQVPPEGTPIENDGESGRTEKAQDSDPAKQCGAAVRLLVTERDHRCSGPWWGGDVDAHRFV